MKKERNTKDDEKILSIEIYKKMILHMLENASERQLKYIYVFVLSFLG